MAIVQAAKQKTARNAGIVLTCANMVVQEGFESPALFVYAQIWYVQDHTTLNHANVLRVVEGSVLLS